jgi:hypothetical protein
MTGVAAHGPGILTDAQFGVYFGNLKVTTKPMKYPIAVLPGGSLWLLFASDPGSAGWPIRGGTPEMNMGSSVYATPVPANGALFVTNRSQLGAFPGK